MLEKQSAEITRLRGEVERLRGEPEKIARAIVTWAKLSGDNNYRIRMGGDPGEEALDKENALLDEFISDARSLLNIQGE